MTSLFAAIDRAPLLVLAAALTALAAMAMLLLYRRPRKFAGAIAVLLLLAPILFLRLAAFLVIVVCDLLVAGRWARPMQGAARWLQREIGF